MRSVYLMNTIKLHFIFSLIILSVSAYGQTKATAAQNFADGQNLKHANIGFYVQDATGKEIAAHNKDISFTPASVLKTITTATALELLGPDYKFKTTLSIDKYDSTHVFVHGYGDPTLGSAFLGDSPTAFVSEWVRQIKQNISSNSTLKITIIDDYLGYDGIPHRWIRQDMGSYYAPGSYGISIFDNTYELELNTTRRDTCPLITGISPAIDLDFQNILTLGQDDAYIFGQPFSNERLLIGSLPAGKSQIKLKGDIPNPGLYLGQVLANELEKNGIKVRRIETTYDKYFDHLYSDTKYQFEEEVFYTHLSPPLRDIIKDTNVRSNNHYAEYLLRAIGRTKNTNIYSNPLDEGLAKVYEFWKHKGVDTNGLFMFDGSGLAPSNAVSAAFVCDMLSYMQHKSKYSKDYLDSFPIAGKTGTVRSLLQGTRLEGKVFVKSGTIVNVRTYAGYYIDGEKKYTFAILVNNYNGPRNEVVKAIEKLLLATF